MIDPQRQALPSRSQVCEDGMMMKGESVRLYKFGSPKCINYLCKANKYIKNMGKDIETGFDVAETSNTVWCCLFQLDSSEVN